MEVFTILKAQDIKTRAYILICIILSMSIIICTYYGERIGGERKKQLLLLKEKYLQTKPADPIQNESPSDTPSTVPAGKSVAPEPDQPDTAPTSPSNDTILLKPGDKGTEVINLQRKLYEIGYNITVDGIYGNAIVNTLKTIQTENKLNASGNYTVETKKILDNIKNIRTYKKP